MKRFAVWSLALVVIVAVALALSACGIRTTTCYGVEPDKEVEMLRPCPEGWKDGDKRDIGEDQFDYLEYDSKKGRYKRNLNNRR